MMEHQENFQIMDSALFFGFFAISLFVGIFYAYRDRNKMSTINYYYGGKNVSTIPIGISFAVTFASAITVIGIPAEVYLYGFIYGWQSLSIVIAVAVICKYYIPLYHKLQVVSVCQYLELRFNRSVRLTMSSFNIFIKMIYLAIVTFVPALALTTVTPLDLTSAIVITTVICTIYTTLGGFVAVIWTDVLQSIVMVVGMLAILISTVDKAGGMESVWAAAYRGGRINFFKFEMDPRIRSSFAAILVGHTVGFCGGIACSQSTVQRFLACKSVRKAQLATALSLGPIVLFFVISCLNGLAAYAYYEGCDPLKSNQITKPDQLIPFMSLDVLNDVPGIAGLFVSAAFCATLSTVSSSINALSVLALEDFVLMIYPRLSQKRRILAGKMIAILCGASVLLASCLITLSPNNVTQLLAMCYAFNGPQFALYTMGVFMPWIDCKGALVGCGTGLVVALLVTFSALFAAIDTSQWQRLPQLVSECTFVNQSMGLNTTMSTTTLGHSNSPAEQQEIGILGSTIFAISPFLHGTLGLLVSIITAHIVSIFTGFRKPSKEELHLSVCAFPTRFLPKCLKKYFVPE